MFSNKFGVWVENTSIWFQGGVRRWVIIFAVICLALLAPIYFLGGFISAAWFRVPFNPSSFDQSNYFLPKYVIEKPLPISNTQVIKLKDGSKELYVNIDNKENKEIGFFPFVYNVQILDEKGAALEEQTNQTYILPGDIKYIVYHSFDGNANKLQIQRSNKTTPIYYNSLSKKYKKPNITITNAKPEIREFTNDMKVLFTIKNNDQTQIGKVNILFTIRDTRESVVGIGDYVVQNLRPGEQRDITIPYTQPFEREAKIIDVQWSVNYLDAENLK